jgi:hypothetical protein
MDNRTQFGFSTVGFILTVPSGVILGDCEEDYVDVFYGGEGGVLDCISRNPTEDLSEKFRDLYVIIIFFMSFLKIVWPPQNFNESSRSFGLAPAKKSTVNSVHVTLSIKAHQYTC